jgi:hypothetical protein
MILLFVSALGLIVAGVVIAFSAEGWTAAPWSGEAGMSKPNAGDRQPEASSFVQPIDTADDPVAAMNQWWDWVPWLRRGGRGI